MPYLFRTLYRLFDRATKLRFLGLFALMLVGALLEMLSITLLIPMLQILVEPDTVREKPWLAPVLDRFPDIDLTTLLLAACGVVLAVMMVKNAAILFIVYLQNRFINLKQAEYSERLFRFYLRQPYLFHLARNSTELMRNASSSVARVFTGGVLPALSIALEALLGAAACLVLLLVEPRATLVIFGLLCLGGGALYFFLRRRAIEWGGLSHALEARVLKALQEGLGSIKELLLLGRERHVASVMGQFARQRARVDAAHMTLLQAPRLTVEIIASLGFVILVALLVLGNGTTQEVVPTLGVFAVAAFRMMPSVNRLLGHLNTLKSATAAIHTVADDLLRERQESAHSASRPPAQRSLSFSRELRVDDVSFQYPDRTDAALQTVKLVLRRGSSTALVGASGSGKSTLASLLLGLFEPTQGRITVDGQDIGPRQDEWRTLVGYVPQDIFLSDDTIRRNIAFALPDTEIDDRCVEEAIRLAQLEPVIARLPLGLDTPVGERGARLSGGQRQRIGIARALYHRPALLVLDEATSALDSETEREVSQAIESLRGHKTVLVIAHRLSTVRLCDTLVLMADGCIVAKGTFDGLMEESEPFRRLVRLAAMPIPASPAKAAQSAP